MSSGQHFTASISEKSLVQQIEQLSRSTVKVLMRWGSGCRNEAIWVILFFVACCYADEPFIVGLAGGSGSGKTTLALTVQQVLGKDECAVIHADDYYKPLAALHSLDFDSPNAIDFKLIGQHLSELKAGKSVQMPCYDFSLSDRIGVKKFEPKKIIIIEGFLLFTVPEILNLFDMTVFLDADEDLLCLRRMERDLLVLNRTFPQIRDNYIKHVKPGFRKYVFASRQSAGIVLNANVSKSEVVGQFIQKINEGVGKKSGCDL
jgi:uridine kinase